MLNVHDLKAAYEQAIGHPTSNSTVYNLLARHGWRKLMPRPFHPRRDLAAQDDFKKAASHALRRHDGRRPDAVGGYGSCLPMKRASAG
jgi:winged helix-turn-helix protein